MFLLKHFLRKRFWVSRECGLDFKWKQEQRSGEGEEREEDCGRWWFKGDWGAVLRAVIDGCG